MFEVLVEGRFRAAHAVRLPAGGMEALHEHDWVVELGFCGQQLDPDGMLVDFCLVQDRLHKITGLLQGSNLNEHPLLRGRSSTAENVARVFYEQLAGQEWSPARLCRVAVREAPGCTAVYLAGSERAGQG